MLRDRHPEIEFVLCDLPRGFHAIYACDGPDVAILVNRNDSPVERLAAVAHELHHHRRGGGCHHPDAPPLLRVLEQKDEAAVAILVCDELLPAERLKPYVDQRAELGMVLARDVAEDFDVPIEVADLALQRLASGF